MTPLLLLVLALPLQPDSAVSARFRALFEKNDREGCAALWREKPALALATIEEDLDQAFAIRAGAKEGAKEIDPAEVGLHEKRAAWGAAVARDALAAPLIADLAAARIGWTSRERGFYDDERGVYAKAKQWLEKGENKFAIEASQEAVNRALALGDWHGAATAYESCAIGHQAMSNFDDALVSWTQASLLNRELRLAEREIACSKGALDMCFATERPARGREIADQAAAAARAAGDKKAEVDFLTRRAGFEEKLGLAAEAAASRKEAAKQEK